MGLKVPAAHRVQPPPLAPEKPGSHRQLSMLAAPARELEFAGHIEHAADPAAFLNLPAAHSVHTPPFAPVYPALHSHVVLPSFEYEFSGHGIQAADHTWTSHRVKCMLLKVTK